MRTIALTLLLAVSSLSGSALAYTDTNSAPDNQQEAIDSLTQKGLVQGYEDGTYRPNQSVNRAEFLKVLVAAAGRELVVSEDPACFTDFTGTVQWYWAPACAAKKANIINGYEDGTFRGSKYINIAEAAKIAANAFDLTLPVYIRAPDHWYEPYMTAMSGEGVFDGVRNEPSSLLTRGEMAFMILKLSSTPLAQCNGYSLGDTYKIACNTCVCTENGSACTKMACPEQKKCFSSNDCSAGQRCSTERGDCQSACDDPSAMCPAVCAGICE